jgi:ABC-type glycerol-3-phosphate transport system permease component
VTIKRRSDGLRAVVIVAAVIVCLLPLVWTLLASFGLHPDASRTPPTWSGPPEIGHYLEIGVAELQYVPKLVSSVLLALLTTFLTVLVAFPGAYGLARARFHGREVVVQGLIVLASLPVIAYLIPLRETLHALSLYDTLLGAALAEAGLYAPLATYVLHGYLRRSPIEIEDAARLEGASTAWLLWRVVLPVVAPGVAATAIVVLVLSWNQVLMPLVLTLRVKTVPVAMIDFFTYERELEWPTAAAALIASLAPIWAVVIAAHRWLGQFSLDGGVQTGDEG